MKRTDLPFNERHHPDRPDPNHHVNAKDTEPLGPQESSPFAPFPLYHSDYTVPQPLRFYKSQTQLKFPNITCSQRALMEEHNCVLDHAYPESFLSSNEFFVRLPLVSSDVLLRCVQRFRESIPKGHRTKTGYINFIKNDFAQQTNKLMGSSTQDLHQKNMGFDVCACGDYARLYVRV